MKPNRIFCIGRNYAEHIEELGNSPDSACVVFMKPVSAIVSTEDPIVLPIDRGDIHHEAELVVLLTGGGRDIAPEHALDCVAGITLGLDLTARDLQNDLKKRGLPWELAKSFDGSAPLGEFRPYLEQDLQAMEYTLTVNGQVRQHADTSKMLFPVDRLISLISRSWSLEPGDMIFTGTPKGVAALKAGDDVVLEGRGLGRHVWQCR